MIFRKLSRSPRSSILKHQSRQLRRLASQLRSAEGCDHYSRSIGNKIPRPPKLSQSTFERIYCCARHSGESLKSLFHFLARTKNLRFVSTRTHRQISLSETVYGLTALSNVGHHDLCGLLSQCVRSKFSSKSFIFDVEQHRLRPHGLRPHPSPPI